jgi:hypothetical protein
MLWGEPATLDRRLAHNECVSVGDHPTFTFRNAEEYLPAESQRIAVWVTSKNVVSHKQSIVQLTCFLSATGWS